MLSLPLDLIARILRAERAAAPVEAREALVRRVVIDSRECSPGDLFVAIAGERVDGHRYVRAALDRGAVGALVTRERADPDDLRDPRVLATPDAIDALGVLAAWHRSRCRARIVVVTGSVGKTTTKDFMAGILSECGCAHKNRGNLNNELGLPLTLLGLSPDHEFAVVELAMRGPGQIRALAEMARPERAIITNIGHSHIELLGSRQAIAEAKSEVLDYLPFGGAAILPAQDDFVEFLCARVPCGANPVLFGANDPNRSSLWADVESGVDASGLPVTTMRIRGPGSNRRRRVALPVLGRHNAMNALSAAACAWSMGLPNRAIADGLERAEISAMRMTRKQMPDGVTLLDDAYNASSPEAMRAALEVLSELPASRRIAVLGDMLELGEESLAVHSQVGEMIAAYRPDDLIAFGERAERYVTSAVEAGYPDGRCVALRSHSAVVDAIRERSVTGAAILVKGSRGMQMEQIVAALAESGG